MHTAIGVHNNINDIIQDRMVHLCLFGKLEGSLRIRRFLPEFTYPFFHMRGKFAMINTCDKFLDLFNLLGMYLTVAVCTCETHRRYCNQTFAEWIPIFCAISRIFHIALYFLKFSGILGRCPLFADLLAAFLGLFFAVVKSIGNRAARCARCARCNGSECRYCADGACDRKRDDSSNACCGAG